ncbi:UNVERIFIED_ORG: hypothetical protein DFO82_0618 [Idiomarina abyssalis]|uniref:SecDF P1 head subdomain-containing protein n=2 Tax=Idiomarinaceae TaxID=267893 RepID=UPI000C51E8A6|nr:MULTISPECIES: hypothetical protein [Idiomarina]MAA62457.1 hypothetical protein [Idiomarina sp.]PWW35326.1 hypothetical protein DFO83_109107 [Idiomarina loihiensis]TDO53389.1 hypothetical protein DEU30_101421 [Idiomarina sp. 017G]TDP45266.1 hypothetical protein DET58_109107 [Idiomarina loihiensis]TDS21013.1 hypothetical protein DET62_10925 [Idiomarina sp. H2]
MTNFKYILVLALLVSAFTYADDTAIAEDKEKYCDFNLYLPAKSEGAPDTLLLERSDLSSLNTTTDNNTVQWTIEVADHALSKWKAASKEHIGLPMRIYCGDELISSPVVRAPLGKKFRVTGMDEGARRIR